MPLPTGLQMQHEGEMGGATPAHSIAQTGMQPSNTVTPQGNQLRQLLRLATYAATTTLEHNLAPPIGWRCWCCALAQACASHQCTYHKSLVGPREFRPLFYLLLAPFVHCLPPLSAVCVIL